MQAAVSVQQSCLCRWCGRGTEDFFGLPQGTVLTPTMDHAMSIQPTSMMGPLTQQLSHLSLGSTGTVPSHPHALISSALRTDSVFMAPLCFPPVYSSQHSYARALHPTVHPSASLQRPGGKRRSVQPSADNVRGLTILFFSGERWSTAAGHHGDHRRTHKLHIPTHKVNLR